MLAGSLGLLVYAYLLYPLLAVVLARIARRPHERAPIEPPVSVVITAYNEERDIAAKLENTLALDYPQEKLEIVVASDGSTDRTDEIVTSFAGRGVKLAHAEGHPGKSIATALAVAGATGEILVFSDATGTYERNALRALVACFADSDVGAVSGRVTYSYEGSAAAEGFRTYQGFVVLARAAESEWGTETSVSGSISAIRRELFRGVPPHLDYDFAHPLHVAQAGLRTVYEPRALSRERARESAGAELTARVRMAILAYSFVPYLVRGLLRVRRPSYVFQVVSHKLARWLSPFALIALLLSSALLATSSPLAVALLALQLTTYAAAALAHALPGPLPGPPLLTRALGVPLFFTTIHLAFLLGFCRWLQGERVGAWTPDRERE